MWVSVCEHPDADELVFSKPRYAGKGFLRCKPLVMSTGDWLCFNYDQMSDRYGYSVSSDDGATFVRHYGARKIPSPFDEAMAYEKKNGDIRMFARTMNTGDLAESVSHDAEFTLLCREDSVRARAYGQKRPPDRANKHDSLSL